MEVKLSPEIERKVKERVGGPYQSPSDVVEEALKAFFGPETLPQVEIDDLNHHIEIGLAEAGRGETVDGEAALQASRARLKSRDHVGLNGW